MTYVIAAPEMMTSATNDLATIGSNLSAAHTAAATPTTGVLAAAQDEVSAAIAAVFSAHGRGFQALGAQAAAFHDRFTQLLGAGANSYAATEAESTDELLLQDAIALMTERIARNEEKGSAYLVEFSEWYGKYLSGLRASFNEDTMRIRGLVP